MRRVGNQLCQRIKLDDFQAKYETCQGVDSDRERQLVASTTVKNAREFGSYYFLKNRFRQNRDGMNLSIFVESILLAEFLKERKTRLMISPKFDKLFFQESLLLERLCLARFSCDILPSLLVYENSVVIGLWFDAGSVLIHGNIKVHVTR